MIDASGDAVAEVVRIRPARYTADVQPRSSTVSLSQSGLPLRMGADGPLAVTTTPSRLMHLRAKRVLDVVLSLLALLLLGPLLLLVAIAIKLTSPGPVLYLQTRIGLNGVPFVIYKFRTMHANVCDTNGMVQAKPDDQRVTPIGRFLRKTSIDELPQLFNVVKGDMSLIGPRPYPAGMMGGGVLYHELVPFFGQRYGMRPGISGWAQANGLRGPTTDERLARMRVDHDIAYIQNFSIWLDLKTIWLTVKNEFLSGTGL